MPTEADSHVSAPIGIDGAGCSPELLSELYRLGFRRLAVPMARRDETRFVLGRQHESEMAVVSQALGFIETIGLVAAIQAADAMAKAANVKLVTRQFAAARSPVAKGPPRPRDPPMAASPALSGAATPPSAPARPRVVPLSGATRNRAGQVLWPPNRSSGRSKPPDRPLAACSRP